MGWLVKLLLFFLARCSSSITNAMAIITKTAQVSVAQSGRAGHIVQTLTSLSHSKMPRVV